MSDKKTRRTVADADKEIEKLKEELKAAKQATKDALEAVASRDVKIEKLKAEVVPTNVQNEMDNLQEFGKKFEPGLYVAKGTPMNNSETGQMFHPGQPLKVTADQLKSSWMLLQLRNKTVIPFEG